MAAVVGFFVLPVAFLAATSFKSRDEVLSGFFLPQQMTTSNWFKVFEIAPMHLHLLNSLVVALVSMVVTLLLAVPAVYAVVKLRRGHALAGALLSSYVAPPVGLLRSFFKQVPLTLDEAAWIDGAGPWKTLWRINLPLVWPGLVSTALICLILSYNEFLFASVLNNRPDTRTITVAISLFQGERVVNFGQMAAASLIGIAPVYALAMLFQRHLVGGLSATTSH